VGVPWVAGCSSTWLVFLIHANDINLIHRGRAKFSVSVRRLVLVKMCETNRRKLFVKIIRNSEVRINVFPFFSFHFLSFVLISLCYLFISQLNILLFRDGINQILAGISSSPMVVLVQLNGSLLISAVGSKINNKFLITFILFY
jgi:hypothetical protein